MARVMTQGVKRDRDGLMPEGAVEVTDYGPCKELIPTVRGVVRYLDWCASEVERMRAAGVSAGVNTIGAPGRELCCVVRYDNPLWL